MTFFQLGQARINLNNVASYAPVEKHGGGNIRYGVKILYHTPHKEDSVEYFPSKEERDAFIKKLDDLFRVDDMKNKKLFS